MVEVKSLKNFTDKETGVFHKVGDSFSCEAERAKELVGKNAVVIQAEVDAPTEKKPTKKATKKK